MNFENSFGELKNRFGLFLGKRRYLRRLIKNKGPIEAVYNFRNKLFLHLYARDYYGPSFNVMNHGDDGFQRYEKENLDELSAFLNGSSVFIDIGANVGIFSFYFLLKYPGLRAFAYEPHPFYFDLISKTNSDSGLEGFHAFNLALGAKKEVTELFLSVNNSGGHTMHSGGLPTTDEQGTVTITVDTLDNQVAKQKLDKVDVVKIDVQGYEYEVLSGAGGTIAEFRPVLLVEVDNKRELERKHGLGELLDDAVKSGYSFRVPGTTGNFPVTDLRKVCEKNLEDNNVETDYLFFPPA